MAEGSVFESSYINVNNCTSSWDSSIIIESIKSKSIAYDGSERELNGAKIMHY